MHHDADLVILGGGSGGYAAALRAAQLGMGVTLIEKNHLGGTCLHQGCVPTKALLHAAELADAARDGAAHGISVTFGGVDMAGVNRYKSAVVDRLYKGLSGLVKAAGIRVVSGEGRVDGPATVRVGADTYTGRNLVLATGSRARMLPGVTIGGRVVTSELALTLDEVPERAVVIGGSVIGVEFASVWRSLGAEVTIVEALPSLVPLEDPAIGKQLERAFRQRAIGFRGGARVREVKQSADEALVVLEGGDLIGADLVLVAVGREPVTDGLGYEENGIVVERGWIRTDERLRTAAPHVWAVGDLVEGLQLAHRGFAHGIFVAEEVAGLDPSVVEGAGIPRVTYCNPEIASVGLSEAQAREAHGEVETYEYDLAGNGRSQILGTSGFVKVVREVNGPVVGVHMLGARMGEQVGEAALWVNWEALPEDVARFVHAHPTQNEALGEAALALAGRPLHAHG